jgi:hypothetical protein
MSQPAENHTPSPDEAARRRRPKLLRRLLTFLAVLCAGPLLVVSCGNVRLGQDWRTADRSPTDIAPKPETTREAVVQVYAARAFNWRGMFAVHTWIATKAEHAPAYTVHQVVGWRRWRDLPVVVSAPDVPDRSWYGNPPEIIADLRGPEAERVIEQIHQAVASYPYPEHYTLWPGPNSNTFTAHVAREVPAMGLELPTTAIGKDYLTNGSIAGRGITAAWKEGLEFNLLGLAFGIDPQNLAIKLPGIGNLGFRQ